MSEEEKVITSPEEAVIETSSTVEDVSDKVEETGIERKADPEAAPALNINGKIKLFDEEFLTFKKGGIQGCKLRVDHITALASDRSLQDGQRVCLRKRASKLIKLAEMLEGIE